jgi:hypothetical protein
MHMNTRPFHEKNTIPKSDAIWVFATDEAGKHRNSEAKIAHVTFKAKYGFAAGPTAMAYAIPTRDKGLQCLPEAVVRGRIQAFIEYALTQPKTKFFIANQGFEAWKDAFSNAPQNCSLVKEWGLAFAMTPTT